MLRDRLLAIGRLAAPSRAEDRRPSTTSSTPRPARPSSSSTWRGPPRATGRSRRSLVIHGGAWRAATRPMSGRSCPSSPSAAMWRSRRSTGSAPRTRFPAQVHDVKAAVRWLKAQRQEVQGRPRPHRRDRLLGRGPPGADAGRDRARPTAWKATSRPVLPTAGSRPSSTTSARPTWPPTTSPTSPSPWSRTSWAATPQESRSRRPRRRR